MNVFSFQDWEREYCILMPETWVPLLAATMQSAHARAKSCNIPRSTAWNNWRRRYPNSPIQAKSKQNNNVLRLVRQPACHRAPPSPTQPSKPAHLTTCTFPACSNAGTRMQQEGPNAKTRRYALSKAFRHQNGPDIKRQKKTSMLAGLVKHTAQAREAADR